MLSLRQNPSCSRLSLCTDMNDFSDLVWCTLRFSRPASRPLRVATMCAKQTTASAHHFSSQKLDSHWNIPVRFLFQRAMAAQSVVTGQTHSGNVVKKKVALFGISSGVRSTLVQILTSTSWSCNLVCQAKPSQNDRLDSEQKGPPLLGARKC